MGNACAAGWENKGDMVTFLLIQYNNNSFLHMDHTSTLYLSQIYQYSTIVYRVLCINLSQFLHPCRIQVQCHCLQWNCWFLLQPSNMEVTAGAGNMTACVFLFDSSGTLFDIFCLTCATVYKEKTPATDPSIRLSRVCTICEHIYAYECTVCIQHPKEPNSSSWHTPSPPPSLRKRMLCRIQSIYI